MRDEEARGAAIQYPKVSKTICEEHLYKLLLLGAISVVNLKKTGVVASLAVPPYDPTLLACDKHISGPCDHTGHVSMLKCNCEESQPTLS